jgi:hypothetical protein
VYTIPNTEWPESDLLLHLFSGAKDVRAEIPSLESVDDSIDRGKLRKVVLECKKLLTEIKAPGGRLKCQKVLKLKELIGDAWKRQAEYSKADSLITPKACHVCAALVTENSAVCAGCVLAIHADCGSSFDGSPMKCFTCGQAEKTNPPCLAHRSVRVSGGGEKWIELQVERYGMIVNLVNPMILNGVTDPFYPEGDGSIIPTQEARHVLIAVGMHDPVWMGDTTEHFVLGLKAWLPKFFHSLCCGYLTAVYQVAMIRERQPFATRLSRIYFSKDVRMIVDELMENIRFNPKKKVDELTGEDNVVVEDCEEHKQNN